MHWCSQYAQMIFMLDYKQIMLQQYIFGFLQF